MSKNAFITGTTGFLGSYLAEELLRKEYKVKGLKRETSDLSLVKHIAEDIEWVVGDITDHSALENAIEEGDLVFHCAAMISYAPVDFPQMRKINVKGTETLVNACLEKGVGKLIHTGSISSLPKNKDRKKIVEAATLSKEELSSEYGRTKLDAELEVWRGAAEGLSMAIVNPSVIIGAGNWNSGSCRLIKRVHEGLKYYPLGGTGFVDVRDVVKFMVLLTESGIENERFILNGFNDSYKDFFKDVAQELGVPAPSIPVTPFKGGLAWRLEKIKSMLARKRPLLTKETVKMAGQTHHYNASKSRIALDFEYTPREKTIHDTCKAFLKQKNGFSKF